MVVNVTTADFKSGDAQFHIPSIIKYIRDNNPTHLKPVAKDHVWDENQSVKWNKEKTELYNASCNETNRKNRIDFQLSLSNLDNAIIDWLYEDVNYCIQQENWITKTTIRRFFNKFQEEKGTYETYDQIRFISNLLTSLHDEI